MSEAHGDAPVLPYRVGHGFDLHRLEPGFPLIIGGVNIPHERGCDAHSDGWQTLLGPVVPQHTCSPTTGDVLLHCIVDAILGALSLPDIGQLFSDKDPRWKGASSDIFIKEAVRVLPTNSPKKHPKPPGQADEGHGLHHWQY